MGRFSVVFDFFWLSSYESSGLPLKLEELTQLKMRMQLLRYQMKFLLIQAVASLAVSMVTGMSLSIPLLTLQADHPLNVADPLLSVLQAY